MTSTKWQLPRPTVFTPFLRRFTDEKTRDIAETKRLFLEITARHRATRWSKGEAVEDLAEYLFGGINEPVPEPVHEPTFDLLVGLLKLEKPIFEKLPDDLDISTLSLKELVDLRRFLRSQEYFLDHEDKVIDAMAGILLGVMDGVMRDVPVLDSPSPFTIPLIHVLPNPGMIVDKLHGSFIKQQFLDLGLFTEINEKRELNLCKLYGILPNAEIRKPLKDISEHDLTPQEFVDAVWKGTPFHNFLMSPVPLKFDFETRYSHVHVVGGSGAGKTQLLQNLILNDLKLALGHH